MPDPAPPPDLEMEMHDALDSCIQKAIGLRDENRALRQALTWCVVNNGETLGDHPKLLERFRQILGMDAVDA